MDHKNEDIITEHLTLSTEKKNFDLFRFISYLFLCQLTVITAQLYVNISTCWPVVCSPNIEQSPLINVDTCGRVSSLIIILIWFISLFDPRPVLNQDQIDKLLPKA